MAPPAPPLSQRCHSLRISSQPSTRPSLPSSSIVPSPSHSMPSSTQQSGNPSIVQPATCPFPSHARRLRLVSSDSTQSTRKGRGILKGLKVAKKASESSDGRLPIMFSRKLGGPIGIHYRKFVDEVVFQMRKHVPIIGVHKWSKISLETKNTIKDKVLERWRLADDDFAQSKIFKIAQERYRGWRATLAATYKAYKENRETLLQNKPEELNLAEWEELILYFESPGFQRISLRNAANRKNLKCTHRVGSKSFSQISFEHQDKETMEEPNDLELWVLVNCSKGQWSNDESKRIYDEANQKIVEIEAKEDRVLSSSERDMIFQSVVAKKSSYTRGRGYMGKPPTSAEWIRAELQEALRKLEKEREERKAERVEWESALVAERANREAEIEAMRVERESALAAAIAAECANRDAEIEAMRQTMRQEFILMQANHSQVQRAKNLKPTSFIDSFPDGLMTFIGKMKDVVADGNCGFRVIAEFAGLGQNEWSKVRRDLMDELQSHPDLYKDVYGSRERINELNNILGEFRPRPGYGHWMTMPEMGYLIASRYNVVLFHLSMQQCLTFLPFRSAPVPINERKHWAIGFVNGNHFIQVFMQPGHPVPPIATKWQHRFSVADGWKDAYTQRIQHFKQVVGSDVATTKMVDIIDID